MSRQVVAKNRKAFRDYEILERYEAGLALQGTEVKSIRAGGASLKESFARIKDSEVWLEDCHIAPYSHGNLQNHEPRRPRKLLLHRREINKLIGSTQKSGLTLVPLQMFVSNGRIKLELALARGKRKYDKRETARRKAIQRDIESALKER